MTKNDVGGSDTTPLLASVEEQTFRFSYDPGWIVVYAWKDEITKLCFVGASHNPYTSLRMLKSSGMTEFGEVLELGIVPEFKLELGEKMFDNSPPENARLGLAIVYTKTPRFYNRVAKAVLAMENQLTKRGFRVLKGQSTKIATVIKKRLFDQHENVEKPLDKPITQIPHQE